MINKAATFLLCLALTVSHLCAQVHISTHLTSRMGLSSDEVTALVRDKSGALWIGTSNGLNRYDGFRINRYIHQPLDSLSFPFHNVFSLFADSKGGIWATSDHRVAYLPKGALKFEVWSMAKHELAYALNESDAQQMYLGTTNGLYTLNDQRKWVKIAPYPVYTIHKHKGFFVLSSRGALYKFNYDKKETEGNYADQFPYLGGKLHGPSSTFIFNHHLIIYNNLSGITDANLQTETHQTIRLSNQPIQHTPALWIDSTLQVWCGTERGLYTLSLSDSIPRLQEEPVATPTALQHQTITAITADAAGNLWIGTKHNGVYCYASLSRQISNVLLPVSPQVPVKSAFTSSEYILLGSDGAGLFSIPSHSRTPRALSQKNFKSVWSIAAGVNSYWLGTENGLFAFDVTKEAYSLHKLYTDTLDQTITAIATDKDGSLWLGSKTGLVHYFPKSKDVFIYRSNRNPHTISSDCISTLHFDRNGRLWIGSDKGLDAFNTTKNTAERFGQTLGLSVTVNCIAEDTKGNIWIGTEQGALFRLHPGSRKCENVSGSKHTAIKSLYTADESTIWFTTSAGIFRYDSSKHKTIGWTTDQGLSASGFSSGLLLKLPDGRLLAPHRNGMLIFPQTLPPVKEIGTPYISEVMINGRAAEYSGNTVKISSRFQDLLVFIGDADLRMAANATYQYRVKGYTDEWKTCPYPFISIPGLPEGEYVLEIRSTGVDSDQQSDVCELHLIILGPLWKTKAFMLFCAVIIAGLGWWGIRKTWQQIRIKEQQKHELMYRKLELQQAAFAAQLDSQFISNTLYQIQECINTNQLLQASQYLSKFASYISCVLEYGTNDSITIEQLSKTLDFYLSIERLRFNGDFQFNIRSVAKINAHSTVIPNMVVQPFVENAIRHGLKQKIKDRKMEICFEPWSNKHVLCTIEDNGIGRKAAAHIRIVEQHIDLLNEIHHTETRLEVVDLISEANEASGTKVILHLPNMG